MGSESLRDGSRNGGLVLGGMSAAIQKGLEAQTGGGGRQMRGGTSQPREDSPWEPMASYSARSPQGSPAYEVLWGLGQAGCRGSTWHPGPKALTPAPGATPQWGQVLLSAFLAGTIF